MEHDILDQPLTQSLVGSLIIPDHQLKWHTDQVRAKKIVTLYGEKPSGDANQLSGAGNVWGQEVDRTFGPVIGVHAVVVRVIGACIVRRVA